MCNPNTNFHTGVHGSLNFFIFGVIFFSFPFAGDYGGGVADIASILFSIDRKIQTFHTPKRIQKFHTPKHMRTSIRTGEYDVTFSDPSHVFVNQAPPTQIPLGFNDLETVAEE